MERKRDVVFLSLLVLNFVLGAHSQASHVDPSECRSLVDLYVVVDGSDSISYPDFITLQEAIASLIPQMRIGPKNARLGMLVYSSNVPKSSEHPFYDNPAQLVDAAMTLQHPRDGTKTALGLKHMRRMFELYGRPDVPWVCVTITDGISKNSKATAKEAKLAEQMGISMFAVGIGHSIDLQELGAIASTERQVMALDNFNQLADMLTSMMTTICPCPRPPTVPLAKCADGPRAIGSIRQYQCQDGYLQRGNAAITCRDDSTWTPLSHDFECVACSDITPPVMHSSCGGSDYTIGAIRSYACDTGYLAVGQADIVCQADAMWSQPKIQCIPCGETPVIQHGSCGGGKHTIGSRRRFACDPGYLAIGKPDIVCQADAKWSQPKFQCIPCGDTPVIQHGSCGGGDYTIGSVRRFICDPGYLAVGEPDVICEKNAKWSKPKFQCIPCGDTPVIKHGSCGGGANTIGTMRRFICDPGYLAIGQPEIVCQNDATWSLPQFQCIPCGDTPALKHGSCGGGDYTIGSMRRFTCDPGYLAVGQPEIVCQDNAMWSAPQFQCIPCGDTPIMAHGSCGGGDNTLGSIRRYSCDPGYLAVGEPNIRCQDNAQWSQPKLQCIPCGDTPVIQHGSCGGGDNTIGSVRRFVCDPGYLAVGEPDVICEKNAKWSKPKFQCIPCGDTPIIKHGSCDGGANTIGTMRRFICDPGYLAIGQPEIVCQNDATWSLPQFQCIPCGETPVIKHGSCDGGANTIGTMRRFICDPGYLAIGQPEIVCQNDATWSQPQFQCIPCGDTPALKHGSCGGGDYIIGSVRRFTCDPGYLAIGQPEIICQDNAMWSAPQFQCIPCGDTPLLKHGTCDGGNNTLGSMRRYTCDPGYLAVGQPDIVCQDNAEWSQPKFQCIPCGDTPVIQHGSCDGGDYTLGTIRRFTCDPGYLAVGDPDIICKKNAKWSKPKFQCIPCGDTPVIKHGSCGGGDYTIGTMRRFTCDTGYLAVGQPETVCQANAMWSTPQFQCIPCGDTPILKNGTCGGGDYTIGSRRRYSCTQGYLAVGNPEIVCQDNAVWSTPEFQCIPCGETPIIEHGSCGGGDVTIGTKRTYICEPGYYLKGTADIVCRDDAKWSTPDLVCIPCGMETPVVPNAECGSGDVLIGSTRSYTCSTGYLAVGNPMIECLPNATWSPPGLICKDCGVPPMIANAFTGLGPSTIGSTLDYYCDTGYKMNGRGQIMCRTDGLWEEPHFSCDVITTTTTTTPAPKPKDPSVCDACRLLNGVGFNNHPFDCNQYVQCYIGGRGMEPVYRRCPFGQFWDQNVLTCRPSHLVDCPHDKCASGVTGYKHSDPNSCCSYWKCQNGRSYGECCGEGSSFDPQSGQCVYDDTCHVTCPYEQELQACTRRPAMQDTFYEQHIGRGHWVKMPCAPGTAYNPVDCECSLRLMTIPGHARQQVCKAELYLPFRNGFRDRSGKNVYIQNDNVGIVNGSAYFGGNSRLLINRFSNTEFVGNLVIKFRYKEILEGRTAGSLQALVTNGDCGSDPSIIIAKMPGFVLLGAKTQESRSFALPTLDKEWKEVIYIHNEKRLEGKVCGATGSKWSYGPIQATHCAIQIGYGSGLDSYIGLLDDLYIYQCRPRGSLLNLNY